MRSCRWAFKHKERVKLPKYRDRVRIQDDKQHLIKLSESWVGLTKRRRLIGVEIDTYKIECLSERICVSDAPAKLKSMRAHNYSYH